MKRVSDKIEKESIAKSPACCSLLTPPVYGRKWEEEKNGRERCKGEKDKRKWRRWMKAEMVREKKGWKRKNKMR